MPPQLVFGGGGIGGTEKSFTYSWDTPEKVRPLLQDLQRLGFREIDAGASYPPTNPWNTETLLGQTHAAQPEGGGFVIDSKIAMHVPGPTLNDENISTSLAKTLELLGVPKVHILYAHMPDVKTPLEETAKAFDIQFKAGKFEKLGLCNYSADLLKEYFAICDEKGYVKPSVIQDHYNAIRREHEENLFPLIRQHGCVFYAFSPLAGGFLTGKVTQSRDAANTSNLTRTRWEGESTLAHYAAYYDRPEKHEAVRQLKKACETCSSPMALPEASLRWLLNHSALQDGDAIIIGATKVDQLESNIKCASRGPLPKDIFGAIDRAQNSSKI